jgi:hypothetical protein
MPKDSGTKFRRMRRWKLYGSMSDEDVKDALDMLFKKGALIKSKRDTGLDCSLITGHVILQGIYKNYLQKSEWLISGHVNHPVTHGQNRMASSDNEKYH